MVKGRKTTNADSETVEVRNEEAVVASPETSFSLKVKESVENEDEIPLRSGQPGSCE